MIIAYCKLTYNEQSNPWVFHFKTIEINLFSCFNSPKSVLFTDITSISFLPFSSVENLLPCSKNLWGKFSGDLIG